MEKTCSRSLCFFIIIFLFFLLLFFFLQVNPGREVMNLVNPGREVMNLVNPGKHAHAGSTGAAGKHAHGAGAGVGAGAGSRPRSAATTPRAIHKTGASADEVAASSPAANVLVVTASSMSESPVLVGVNAPSDDTPTERININTSPPS